MAAPTQFVQPIPMAAPVIISAPNNQNLQRIKGLAITQLVIGSLTLIFGIVVAVHLQGSNWRTSSQPPWTTKAAGGVWAGVWIIITGILGVSSANIPTNRNLSGAYTAFSIISTCVSGLAGLSFLIALEVYGSASCYYRTLYNGCLYNNVGLGLHAPLLILMATEFFVSIFAAVFSCQNGCATPVPAGIVIQQQPIAYGGQPMAFAAGGVVANPYAQYAGQPPMGYGGQVPYSNQANHPYAAQQLAAQPQQYAMQTNVPQKTGGQRPVHNP